MIPARILMIGVVLGALPGASIASTATDPGFELSATCPPSFMLSDDNRCEFRHLYRLYDSLRDAGVGGLKTGLPAIRDGFSPQQIDLGRYLFFDPVLSADAAQSCASCHHPELAFSDGEARSVGANGARVKRSAPSLWNVGFQKTLFWDARADSLETQATGPLYADDEMANQPHQLRETLNAIAAYRELFTQAFPESSDQSITLDQVYTALAAFESTLISLNSRYDHYAHGDHDALSQTEIDGLNVFRSFVARCAECHTPPLFTNQQLAVLGIPEADGQPLDPGREAITGDPSQRAAFKVPSLRNVTQTAPYMHAGSMQTLADVMAFYTGGRGHAVPDGEELSIHWHIWEPDLSIAEQEALTAFLGALNDNSFTPSIPRRVPSGHVPIGRLPRPLQEEITHAAP